MPTRVRQDSRRFPPQHDQRPGDWSRRRRLPRRQESCRPMGWLPNGSTKERCSKIRWCRCFQPPKVFPQSLWPSRRQRDTSTMTPEWPTTAEFAQAGKASVTVRQLLSHQVDCPSSTNPSRWTTWRTGEDVGQNRGQRPAWTPGERHGYHNISLGFYESELIRHADPAGRTVGRFFAEEIARPPGLDFYIGLPTSVNRDCERTDCWSRAEMLLHLYTLPPRDAASLFNPRSRSGRAVQCRRSPASRF